MRWLRRLNLRRRLPEEEVAIASLLERERFEQAAERCRSLLAELDDLDGFEASKVQLGYGLAVAERRAGAPERAVEAARAALTAHEALEDKAESEVPRFRLVAILGLSASEAGDREHEIQALTEWTETAPDVDDRVLAHEALGLAHLRAGDCAAAADSFQRALELLGVEAPDRRRAIGHHNLGTAYVVSAPHLAKNELERALALLGDPPSDSELHSRIQHNLGALAERMGDEDAAYDAYSCALSSAPLRRIETLRRLGRLAREQGRELLAMSLLQEAESLESPAAQRSVGS